MPSPLPTPLYFPGGRSWRSDVIGQKGEGDILSLSAPAPGIFLLTLLGGETHDNRITGRFTAAFSEALAWVEQRWAEITSGEEWNDWTTAEQGAALVTTGQTEQGSKFFSNGLDLEAALEDPVFFDDKLNPVYTKLLSFPIPTVASIGGHAFAAGFGLVAAHDYRIMSGRRGYLCMNEIFFGAQLPGGILAALESSIKSAITMRKIVLEGARFGGAEALHLGLVDGLVPAPSQSKEDKSDGGGSAATLEGAIKFAQKLKKLAAKDAWGSNKQVLNAREIAILRTKNEVYMSKL